MQGQERCCANCDRQIGRLEEPRDWRGHLVCASCHRILSAENGRRQAAIHSEWISSPEAAALLGVTKETIWRWATQQRRLTYRKPGKDLQILRADVEQLVERSTCKARPKRMRHPLV